MGKLITLPTDTVSEKVILEGVLPNGKIVNATATRDPAGYWKCETWPKDAKYLGIRGEAGLIQPTVVVSQKPSNVGNVVKFEAPMKLIKRGEK